MIDNQTPPSGESHGFPDLPFAFVCFSEIITVPSETLNQIALQFGFCFLLEFILIVINFLL